MSISEFNVLSSKFKKFEDLSKQSIDKSNYSPLLDKRLNPMYSRKPDFIKIKIANYFKAENFRNSSIPPISQFKALPPIRDGKLCSTDKEQLLNKLKLSISEKGKTIDYKSRSMKSVIQNSSSDIQDLPEDSSMNSCGKKRSIIPDLKHLNLKSAKSSILDLSRPTSEEVFKRVSVLSSVGEKKMKKLRTKKSMIEDIRYFVRFGYSAEIVNIGSTSLGNGNTNSAETMQVMRSENFFFQKFNCMVIQNFHIFGLCTGFGVKGQEIAQNIKFNMMEYFNDHTNFNQDKNNRVKHFHNTQTLFDLLKNSNYTAILDSIKQCIKNIKRNKNDYTLSGAILNLLLIIDDLILCLNLGDNRSVVFDGEKYYSVNQLHNSSREEERLRILSYKYSSIERKPKDDYDNVYLRFSDKPGLRVTRCIGNNYSTEVGVLSVPEISEYRITSQTKFLVLANIHLWTVLKEFEVNDIVSSYYNSNFDPDLAAIELASTAKRLWSNVSKLYNIIKPRYRIIQRRFQSLLFTLTKSPEYKE